MLASLCHFRDSSSKRSSRCFTYLELRHGLFTQNLLISRDTLLTRMLLVSVFTTSRTISIRDYNTDKSSAGFTMRRPTWGILPMDIALSVSHEPTSGLTCALLLGCSNLQAKFLCEEVKTYAM